VRIETERTVLRPIALGDLEDFVALHAEPDVARFVRAFDRREAQDRIQADAGQWAERGHGMVAILDRFSGRFLGRAGLRYWPQFDETEVGWALRREVWGHGYATEAGRACIDWGFRQLPLDYLTAMIQPTNARSIGVAERLGLQPLRLDVLLDDQVQVYAVSRDAWRSGLPALAPP
jgi:RimJ/RimL family protein N-acetyltransferase